MTSSNLAGCSTGNSPGLAPLKIFIHMLIFAATLTVTLYALTDKEYPRLGLIRIKNFDHFLVDAYRQMQAPGGAGTVGYGR